MTTLSRREPLHLDFPEWMTRWMDDRRLTERMLPLDLGPAIRLEELTEGDARVVRAELPGVDPEKDRLERAVPLPAGSSVEDVKATYKDGVLEVRMPMQPQLREAAKVPVQRAD